MPDVNLLAVFVAAISSFLIGGLWYSPVLFGNQWVRENGSTEQTGHPAKVFGLSFLFAVISALAFAIILGANASLEDALTLGAIVGVGFVAASFGINYQFANRSTLLLAIDAGYHVVQFLIFGLIMGLWP